MQRFVAAYADVAARLAGRMEAADLRYPQGFAVRAAQGAVVTKPKGKR